jgi:hypothetical protein
MDFSAHFLATYFAEAGLNMGVNVLFGRIELESAVLDSLQNPIQTVQETTCVGPS